MGKCHNYFWQYTRIHNSHVANFLWLILIMNVVNAEQLYSVHHPSKETPPNIPTQPQTTQPFGFVLYFMCRNQAIWRELSLSEKDQMDLFNNETYLLLQIHDERCRGGVEG